MIEKILKVIAIIESNNNPKAFNPKDGAKDFQILALKYPNYIAKHNISPEKCGAYGLHQILLSTAVSLGFDYPPEYLFDVDVNTLYAKLLIKDIMKRYSDLLDIFSVYNSGKPYSKAPQQTKIYAEKAIKILKNIV